MLSVPLNEMPASVRCTTVWLVDHHDPSCTLLMENPASFILKPGMRGPRAPPHAAPRLARALGRLVDDVHAHQVAPRFDQPRHDRAGRAVAERQAIDLDHRQ